MLMFLRQEVFELFVDLHKLRLCHGDVRPSNVLHGKTGGFRLIDFSEAYIHECPDARILGRVRMLYFVSASSCLQCCRWTFSVSGRCASDAVN